MKKLILIALLALPLLTMAQTKIKETDVPKSVLITLEKTYESYKVKTWYTAPGQFIADFVTDGQHGRCYFTASGEWQYSSFPTELNECPTLMNTYFVNNYPGYRIKSTEYIEEMSGDNYYRMVIVKKGVGSKDCELIFDTRGKLQKSTAPDPEVVKRDYYSHNNPDDDSQTRAAAAEDNSRAHRATKKREKPVEDIPDVEVPQPDEAMVAHFNKNYPATRLKEGPFWYQRGYDEFVAYFTNNQKVEFEQVYDIATNQPVKKGKVLTKDRYKTAIIKYLNEKFKNEKYKIEKMVTYEYDSKYRGPDGKKPKGYTYVVVSQKVGGGAKKFTRMEFDNNNNFTGLLAAPLDERDVQ